MSTVLNYDNDKVIIFNILSRYNIKTANVYQGGKTMFNIKHYSFYLSVDNLQELLITCLKTKKSLYNNNAEILVQSFGPTFYYAKSKAEKDNSPKKV